MMAHHSILTVLAILLLAPLRCVCDTITVINAGYGFSWVGCYVDKQNPRALGTGISTTGPAGSANPMTVEYCASFCQGYNYMGVEYADECYCANSVASNSFLATTETGYTCQSNTYACTGNSSEFCGGYGTLDLYSQPDQTSTAAYPDDTGGSYVYVTDSHIVYSQNTTNGSEYDYIGCWVDPGDTTRALNGDVNTGLNDVGTCADYCAGWSYFGLEYGGTCYCGDSIDNGASLAYCQAECYTCCSVDLTQRCGGYYRLSLYELNGPSNFTDPHPDAVCTYNGPATVVATVVSSTITSTSTYYGPVTTGSTEIVVVTTDDTGATTSYTTTSYACDDDPNCVSNPHTPGGASSLSMNMPTETDTTTEWSTSTTTLSLTTTIPSGGTVTTTAISTSTTTLSLTVSITSSGGAAGTSATSTSATAETSAPANCAGYANLSVSTDGAGCQYTIYCGYELNSEAFAVQDVDSDGLLQCEALCDGNSNCAGFTYTPGTTGGTCYLKPAGGSLVASGSSYIGGVLVSDACRSASTSATGSTSAADTGSATESAGIASSVTSTSSSSDTDSGSLSGTTTSGSLASATASGCASINNTQLITADCSTYDLSCGFSIQGTLISTTTTAATNADCATYCDDNNGCQAWTLDDTGTCSVYSAATLMPSSSPVLTIGVLDTTESTSTCTSSSSTTAASSTASTTALTASATATAVAGPMTTAGCSALNNTQLTSSSCSVYDLYCEFTLQGQAESSSTEYSNNACASSCDGSSTCQSWSLDPDSSTCNLYDTRTLSSSSSSDDNNLVVGVLDDSASATTCLSSSSPSSSSTTTACSTVNNTQISSSECRSYDLYCSYIAQGQFISTSNTTTNYACAASCDGISGCETWSWSAETSVCNTYSTTQLSPSSDEVDQDLVVGVLDNNSAADANCASSPSTSLLGTTTTASATASSTASTCSDMNGTQLAIDGASGCDVYELYCGYTIQGTPFAASTTAGTTEACASFCNKIGDCQAWTLDPTNGTCSAYSTTSISQSSETNSDIIIGLLTASTDSSACISTTPTTTTSASPTIFASTLPAQISASTTFTRRASLSRPLTSTPSPTPTTACAALNNSIITPNPDTNATYTIMCNAYINNGNSLALTSANTASECAAFCAGTQGCEAWTLDPGGDCYAYDTTGLRAGLAEYPNWVTGVLREPVNIPNLGSPSSSTAVAAGGNATMTTTGGAASTTTSGLSGSATAWLGISNGTTAALSSLTGGSSTSVFDPGATTSIPNLMGGNATAPAMMPGMTTSPAATAPFGLAPYSGACYCSEMCRVRTTVVPVWA